MFSDACALVDQHPTVSLTVQTDIDIPKLAEGKDISGLCVRLFRLGDFFLLEELKEKAMTELNAHFENTLIFLKTEAENDENPAWLTEILEAIEDAYKDRSTAPILETLLKFVCRNKHKIFQFKDAIGLFDKLPELVKDLLKNGIFHDIAAHPRPHEFRLGLPVLAASQGPDHFYESSYAKPCPIRPTKLPCLLYPAVEISGPVFTAMNPETGGEFDGLGWLTPRASAVRAIVYDPGSALVRVEMHRWDASSLSIRFDDSGDSRLFVERYLRSNPEIFQRRPKKSVLSKRNRRKMPVPDPSDDD